MGSGRSPMSGGGGGGAKTQPQAPQQPIVLQAPTPNDVLTGNVLPKGGVPFSQFENMTDAQKAKVVSDALESGVPMFLDDSGIQRFAYFTGMSDTPKVVSDSQLDKMSGHELFRTVNDAYNKSKDIGYSSKDVAEQIMDGDFTMYSDSGGSAHGRAIYFASSVSSSSGYAGSASEHPVMIRAKVTGGKSISESALTTKFNNAVKSKNPLALACNKARDSASRKNLFALASGFDIITTSDYHMVLNRRCLTVSSKVKTGVSWGTSTW